MANLLCNLIHGLTFGPWWKKAKVWQQKLPPVNARGGKEMLDSECMVKRVTDKNL